MKTNKDINHLIDAVIQGERNIISNPFLSTRIIAAIESKNYTKNNRFSAVWKIAAIIIGFTVTILTGIAAGNLYNNNIKTPDVVLLNDATMENFNFYAQTENE
ncbi:MAG: hypothetical protein IPP48_17150 [Chitinophagaceae bacterium]|nr:hypothetical protein [Chitinophagaceae bacterium]